MNKELIEMLSLLNSNMDKGFTELNNRIDTVDSKIDALEKKVDTGFSSTKEMLHGIGKQFEHVTEQKEASIDEIKQDLKFVTHKLNSVEKDVFNLGGRQ